eukprot:5669284-Prymnesium_polylepis.1
MVPILAVAIALVGSVSTTAAGAPITVAFTKVRLHRGPRVAPVPQCQIESARRGIRAACDPLDGAAQRTAGTRFQIHRARFLAIRRR